MGTLTSLIEEYRFAVDFVVMMVMIIGKLPYHSIPISVMNAGKTAVPTFHFGKEGRSQFWSILPITIKARRCCCQMHSYRAC